MRCRAQVCELEFEQAGKVAVNEVNVPKFPPDHETPPNSLQPAEINELAPVPVGNRHSNYR
jgi:hypothetical protein